MVKKILLALACLTLITISSHASATNIYIAQNATGASNGADCADAKPVSFFNASGNWGSGSAQIGPGTTVHFCGTFTGGANANMAMVQGSGASGNPITLLLEAGANFAAPYWNPSGGAIGCNGSSYITLDGGTNGVVQNTANGTGLGYQQDSRGVDFENCDHAEIRNLTVKNIYIHTGTGTEPEGIGIADFYVATATSVHNNNVTYAGHGIDVNFTNGVSSIQIYNNTTDYHYWGIAIGDETGGSSSSSGIVVYGNNIGPHFDAMLDAAQNYHGDGIIISSPGQTMSNSYFYNNYIHGDLSASPQFNTTAYLFFTGVMDHIYVFNNVLSQDTLNPGAGGPEGLIRIGGTNDAAGTWTNSSIVNNTFVGAYNGSGYAPAAIKFDAEPFTARNNVFYDVNQAYLDNLSGPIGITAMGDVFYQLNNIASALGNVYYTTLASWQAAGFDGGTTGSAGNPMLSSTFMPQSGSSAVGLGQNLTSWGIAALNSDKAGTPRPSSGAWVAGAYQSAVTGPQPPVGLTASVQ